IDILSGQRPPDASTQFLTDDMQLQIDHFRLRGAAQWEAWVAILRNSPGVKELEFIPGTLTQNQNDWVLTAQWQGEKGGRMAVSPPASINFTVTGERFSTIQTERADYTFIIGDSILAPVAFAAFLGGLVVKSAADSAAQAA